MPPCSIGCSRSKVFPANYSRPSPVNFKIFMCAGHTVLRASLFPACRSHPCSLQPSGWLHGALTCCHVCCARRYELNTQVSYDLLSFAGQKGHDPNYIAYQKVGDVQGARWGWGWDGGGPDAWLEVPEGTVLLV